jgi:magnesium chelatase subunit I
LPSFASTLGALKQSPFGAPDRARRSVKDELRQNLLARLAAGGPLFEGVIGYEETVMPQIVNACSLATTSSCSACADRRSRASSARSPRCSTTRCRSSPERGQRQPVPADLKYAKNLLAEAATTRRSPGWARQRYVEKLATPDVTIADIIGDVDPIKAARGGHLLATSSRSSTACCRAPTAASSPSTSSRPRRQGAGGAVQHHAGGRRPDQGYPVRLPLDVLLCFTANPEDYTARGKIITPLKDRIGSEIVTHYPETVELGMAITEQEAWTRRADAGRAVRVPDFLAEVVERVAFEARTDKRVDKRSGVSQRMPITVMENVVSNAERRAVQTGEPEIVPRIADIYAALPAITGKLELEYEGELVGGHAIARSSSAARPTPPSAAARTASTPTRR